MLDSSKGSIIEFCGNSLAYDTLNVRYSSVTALASSPLLWEKKHSSSAVTGSLQFRSPLAAAQTPHIMFK
jgi:hypothetical protein